ncbi:MAG: hypothetical protein A2143_09275 [Gallionellales bacterium RBG_16_57_15]|nr:MAG: hypothetical protein A2143_09275 [Gallionellales bacterium RBG_16_57_15]
MPTFNGDSLTITLDSGIATVDVENDLYKEWKLWQLAGNMRYPQAFRTFGGDALTGAVDAGAYFMFQNQNGWRIRPPEENITILLTGNIAPEDSTKPILIPTIGTYTVLIQGIQPITQNVDSIINEQTTHVKNLQYLIESNHDSPSYGIIFYWNPVSGDDANSGLSPELANKTFSVIHDKLVSGRSDVVMAISSSGKTIVDDTINITKDLVSLRGPGASFDIEPTTQTGATITISGNGVSIEGVEVATASPGVYDAVYCTGDKILLKNLIIGNATGRGLALIGVAEVGIFDSFIGYSASHGIYAEDVVDFEIHGVHIDENGGNGLRIIATAPSSSHEVMIGGGTMVHGSTVGVYIGANVDNTHIYKDVKFVENGVDIEDHGVATYNEATVVQEAQATAVWAKALP